MTYRMRRPRLSAAERTELWVRWKQGERLSDIAAALGRAPATVYARIRKAGGIPERPRQRAARALSAAEREQISRGLAEGLGVRAIARALGRAPSTVSREIARNGGTEGYRAVRAEQAAWRRAARPKPYKLGQQPRLCRVVAEKLEARWSPQQIAGWLQRTFPAEPALQVSHETIYQTLYVQARGALKRELTAYLRTGRRERGRRRMPPETRGSIPGAVSIRERPPTVEDRAIPGHWEGDLLIGARQGSSIATLVERSTRYVVLVKLASRSADHVVQRIQRQLQHLPAELCKTLTWDRGHEMAAHHAFTVATDIPVYFCDPQSPWQRGTNENTNGLLRQYFPKTTDLSRIPQRRLNDVARALNNRPRATLDFHSPAEKFNELLR
jgi:IS30 family transposase